MLPWLEWPVGPQGIPVGVGDWDKAGRGEFGEEDVCDSLENIVVVYYSQGMKTEMPLISLNQSQHLSRLHGLSISSSSVPFSPPPLPFSPVLPLLLLFFLPVS